MGFFKVFWEAYPSMIPYRKYVTPSATVPATARLGETESKDMFPGAAVL